MTEDTPCVIVTTEATLRRYRDVRRFGIAAAAMWATFEAVDGLLGYSMSANMGSRRLTTISAWRDENTPAAFAASSAHREAVEATRSLITDSTILQQQGRVRDLLHARGGPSWIRSQRPARQPERRALVEDRGRDSLLRHPRSTPASSPIRSYPHVGEAQG